MIDLGLKRKARRKPSLTPMIDVVFLLLVFFMLASRFGVDAMIPLPLSGGGGQYSGPPRLVDVLADGVRLNGVALDIDGLARALNGLVESPSDIIVLRGQKGASLQRVVTVSDGLRAAGFVRLVLVE